MYNIVQAHQQLCTHAHDPYAMCPMGMGTYLVYISLLMSTHRYRAIIEVNGNHNLYNTHHKCVPLGTMQLLTPVCFYCFHIVNCYQFSLQHDKTVFTLNTNTTPPYLANQNTSYVLYDEIAIQCATHSTIIRVVASFNSQRLNIISNCEFKNISK
jgi:hypothetical protein